MKLPLWAKIVIRAIFAIFPFNYRQELLSRCIPLMEKRRQNYTDPGQIAINYAMVDYLKSLQVFKIEL